MALMTNLLVVTNYFESHGGGIETVAAEINRRLFDLGYNIEWAAAKSKEKEFETDQKISKIILDCNNSIESVTGVPVPFLPIREVRRLWVAAKRADVVVIHDSLYQSSIVAMLAAKRFRKPVVLIQHVAEIAFSSRVARAMLALANATVVRKMLRSATNIIYVSTSVADHFSHVELGSAASIIFSGIDKALFNYMPNQKVEIRNILGFAPHRMTALFVGRFIDRKGLPALRALAQLRPDVDFLLIGKGPIDPQKWGLSNVTVKDYLAKEELCKYYAASNCFVLLSPKESFSLVVREAMASGLPVICGLDCARADSEGASFLSVIDTSSPNPKDTAQEASLALDRIRDDEHNCRAMSEYARRIYNWDSMVAKLAETLPSPSMRLGLRKVS